MGLSGNGCGNQNDGVKENTEKTFKGGFLWRVLMTDRTRRN